MVDFNNDATVSTSAGDVVKIVILERRYNLIEALEKYNNAEALGMDNSRELAILKSRLFSLFIEIEPIIQRQVKEDDYKNLKRLLFSEEFKDFLEAVFIINATLDKVKLTRIDTGLNFDRRKMEQANTVKGY
jgi:hypothetical protein